MNWHWINTPIWNLSRFYSIKTENVLENIVINIFRSQTEITLETVQIMIRRLITCHVIRIYTVCQRIFKVWIILLFATIDMSKFKVSRDILRKGSAHRNSNCFAMSIADRNSTCIWIKSVKWPHKMMYTLPICWFHSAVLWGKMENIVTFVNVLWISAKSHLKYLDYVADIKLCFSLCAVCLSVSRTLKFDVSLLLTSKTSRKHSYIILTPLNPTFI